MSKQSNSTNSSPHGIDTLIGAGMLVMGDISCSGVLRVQGDINGVVSCNDNSGATLVVDGTGSVTGPVSATYLIVRGRVTGPVQSSQCIEIHHGAIVAGDVQFKEIAIHAGGVLDGMLSPMVAIDDDSQRAGDSLAPEAARLVDDFLPVPSTHGGGFFARYGNVRTFILLAAITVVTLAMIWTGRDQPVAPVRDDNAALKADVSMNITQGQGNAVSGAAQPQISPPVTAGDKTSPAPVTSADATKTDSSGAASVRPGNVVTVRGANPNRPAGVFLLISNEASVLYRKKRDDPGEGTRVPVAQGDKVSVTVAPDELIRIVNGRDVVIFYQGQKVSPSTIESGAWISFVPRTSGSGSGSGTRSDN